VKKCNWNCIWT